MATGTAGDETLGRAVARLAWALGASTEFGLALAAAGAAALAGGSTATGTGAALGMASAG